MAQLYVRHEVKVSEYTKLLEFLLSKTLKKVVVIVVS